MRGWDTQQIRKHRNRDSVGAKPMNKTESVRHRIKPPGLTGPGLRPDSVCSSLLVYVGHSPLSLSQSMINKSSSTQQCPTLERERERENGMAFREDQDIRKERTGGVSCNSQGSFW